MLQCKVKPITEWKNETIFINPKCGHVQKFEYCSPIRCQDENCNEEVPDVEKLFGSITHGNKAINRAYRDDDA